MTSATEATRWPTCIAFELRALFCLLFLRDQNSKQNMMCTTNRSREKLQSGRDGSRIRPRKRHGASTGPTPSKGRVYARFPRNRHGNLPPASRFHHVVVLESRCRFTGFAPWLDPSMEATPCSPVNRHGTSGQATPPPPQEMSPGDGVASVEISFPGRTTGNLPETATVRLDSGMARSRPISREPTGWVYGRGQGHRAKSSSHPTGSRAIYRL